MFTALRSHTSESGVTILLVAIYQQMRKQAGANKVVSYCYAVVALSMLLIVLPTLLLSSEIVPSAVKLCGCDTPELADLLEDYGDRCQSQLRKLELYQDALDMRARAGQKDEKTAKTIYKVWDIKRYWPEYRNTWLKEELATKCAILGCDAEETIRARTMWVVELSHQGNHKLSTRLMRENLQYLKQAPGAHDYEIVSMLEHMNGIFKMNGEPLKERVLLLEEAIKISSLSNSGFLAMEAEKCRLSLAQLRSEMQEYDEAEKQFKIALTLSGGPSRCTSRSVLQDYAKFLEQRGHKGKAQVYNALAEQLPTGRCGTCEHLSFWKQWGLNLPF